MNLTTKYNVPDGITDQKRNYCSLKTAKMFKVDLTDCMMVTL